MSDNVLNIYIIQIVQITIKSQISQYYLIVMNLFILIIN
jgi:hypothetical protein